MRRTSSDRAGFDPAHLISAADADHRVVMTRTSAKLGLRSARLDVRRLASGLFLSLTSFEIPRRLRAFVRAREISRGVLAIAIGVICGLIVGATSAPRALLHRVLLSSPAL